MPRRTEKGTVHVHLMLDAEIDDELRNYAKRKGDLSNIVNKALLFYFSHTNPQKEQAQRDSSDSDASA